MKVWCLRKCFKMEEVVINYVKYCQEDEGEN